MNKQGSTRYEDDARRRGNRGVTGQLSLYLPVATPFAAIAYPVSTVPCTGYAHAMSRRPRCAFLVNHIIFTSHCRPKQREVLQSSTSTVTVKPRKADVGARFCSQPVEHALLGY
ncbi:hypothetical protein IW262DRAFT_1291168 [Armillaria fumosa]|nr:hypothetical protein IW262DRAFT_1291168 [Armillaria fumosa]